MKVSVKNNEIKSSAGRIWLRAILTVLCLGVYAFIFYNSALTEAQSTSQSSVVTDAVQDVVGTIAPESPIATVTGEEYEKLHDIIRAFAHFSEFTLLGALLIWCCFSYTDEAFFFLIPVCLLTFTPIIDESIQLFSSGRIADVKDIIIDTVGGYFGCLFAFISVWIGKGIRKRKKRVQ